MRCVHACASASALGIGLAVAAVFWHAAVGARDGRTAPPKTKIPVSKETTFITEPIAEDGYPDYVAALNAIASRGVTPENNAAVPLYQAFGPQDIAKERREHVARLLGIHPPPDEGGYFIDQSLFLQQNRKETPQPNADVDRDAAQAAADQFEQARRRPWSQDEFPLVAAWLQKNEPAVELIVAASRRERFYFPLFGPGDRPMLIEVLLPLSQKARQAAHALIARAMLRVKAGKIDEAWQDALACHRLARLIAQGPTLIEGLVGIAIEGGAVQADAAIAHHGGLSAERATRFAEDLKHLPPMPKMVDKIRIGERFMFLDAVSMLARRGPAELRRLAGIGEEAGGFVAWLANTVGNAAIDWEEPLRMGNACYDRLVEAFEKPTRAERDAALRQIENDHRQMAQEVKDFKKLLWELATSFPRRSMGRQIGRVLVSLLSPAILQMAKAEDRGSVYSTLGQIALALAAHRAEHGAYPAELAQLVPKHLAAIPEDPFANAPLRYKRTDRGCIVYSVSINGKDEGGANRDIHLDDHAGDFLDADDIAIFMPWPKKK